jgi:hypothetical protein
MRELERLLGQAFYGRPKRQAPVRTVDWVAIPKEGGDSIYLDNIKEARAVAANGWKYEGKDIALIERRIIVNGDDTGEYVYMPGEPITVRTR